MALDDRSGLLGALWRQALAAAGGDPHAAAGLMSERLAQCRPDDEPARAEIGQILEREVRQQELAALERCLRAAGFVQSADDPSLWVRPASARPAGTNGRGQGDEPAGS